MTETANTLGTQSDIERLVTESESFITTLICALRGAVLAAHSVPTATLRKALKLALGDLFSRGAQIYSPRPVPQE